MKAKFFSFISCFILFFSCTKNNSNPGNQDDPKFKLKTIFYPVDSVTLLCGNCPPIVTQESENFIYDSSGRLTSIIVIATTLSDNPVSIDTSAVYSYFYSDNTFLISSYTQTINGYATNHLLTYNSENKIISDSVTNPQISNNKVSYFQYNQGYIVVTDKQTYPIGTQIIVDTMTIDDNNITKEIIKKVVLSNPQNIWNEDLTYSTTSYQNPLSLVNNISLWGSDYKNGVDAIFYNGEKFSNNLASQKITKYWSNNIPLTEYTSVYTAVLDTLGRVISVTNSSDGNGKTEYEYY